MGDMAVFFIGVCSNSDAVNITSSKKLAYNCFGYCNDIEQI